MTKPDTTPPAASGAAPAEDAGYELLSELAGIDTYDVDLRDHPKAWEALGRYGEALASARACEVLPDNLRKSLEWCSTALQALASSEGILECTTFRRGDTGDSKSLENILDEADAALASREAAQPASPAPLTETPQELERALGQAIDERDERDEVIDALCDAVLGKDRAEWSSMYGFRDAVNEVEEHMAALASPQVAPAPESDARQPSGIFSLWNACMFRDECRNKSARLSVMTPPAAPVQVAPAEDGYAKAFYEIASVLGIGARADTPENVFRNEMLPRIKALASQPAAQPAAITADEINGKPPTAQSILEAMVDIQEDYECNAPEHRCYVDSAQREIFEMARRFVAAPMQPGAAADDARDAARYRWLRDSPDGLPISAAAAKVPGAFDAAIDAAMSASTPAAKPAEPTLPTQGDAK